MGLGTSTRTGYMLCIVSGGFMKPKYMVFMLKLIFIRLGNYLFKKITHIHSTLMLY